MDNSETARPPGSHTTDAAGRLRTATLRRSCEACRAVKARCVIDPDNSADQTRCCKRCRNHSLDCVFENALARPKKLRYSARTRVKDVEEKLDGLIALISARKEAAAQATAPTTAVAISEPTLAAASQPPVSAVPASTSGPAPIQPQALTGAIGMHTASGTQVSFPHTNIISHVPIYGAVPQKGNFTSPFPVPVAMDFSFDEVPYLPQTSDPVSQMQLATPHPFSAQPYDVIERGVIGEDLAQLLLADFTMNVEEHFPFVLIPPYVTLSTMRRERPFLLLAVLAVCADTPLQTALALEFRKSLAYGMIVEYKSSLDLLQGLLIFCVWHHRYFKPFSSQLYQLSQIAVTMAMDLDLSKATESLVTAGPMCPQTASKFTPTDEMSNEIERARAYLGTFCLSANIAMAHRKPTHFKYDRKVEQACQFVSCAQDAPSDTLLLPYHIRIRKLAEDVERIFASGDVTGMPVMDEKYIETMVKDFERQYEQIKLSLPTEAWNNASLKCAMQYLPVLIYEVGLRIPIGHQTLMDESPSAVCCSWCSSNTRLAIIIKCLRSGQEYINTYLNIPNSVFRYSTIMEVSRHIDCLLVLTRTSLGFDMKQFQLGNLTTECANLVETANVALYLEMSERKMGEMASPHKVPIATANRELFERQDHYWKMQQIFKFSIIWFHSHVPLRPNSTVDDTIKIGQISAKENSKLNMSTMEFLNEGATMSAVACKFSRIFETDNECTAETAVRDMWDKIQDCEGAMAMDKESFWMHKPTDSSTTPNGSSTTPSGSGSASDTPSASASGSASTEELHGLEVPDWGVGQQTGLQSELQSDMQNDLWAALTTQPASLTSWFDL